MCKDFKILKVKVLILFSGTQGFPARRNKRYNINKSVEIDSLFLLTFLENYN